MFKKEDLNSEFFVQCKRNVSRHLYTYSVSINVALSEYLNVPPFLLIGSWLCSLILSFVISFLYSKLDIDK